MSNLVSYFGHSAGEQFLPRQCQVQSPAVLMGCSSVALDGCLTGPPTVYLQGGSPALIGCLWDVTDRDIDRFTERLLDRLNGKDDWATVIKESRSACLMRHLNGSATVLYRIKP